MLAWHPVPPVMRELNGDRSRTAPARESRLQPVPAAHRLKPGLLGRCLVD